ncbi:MAG: hypothetical protein AB7E61_00530 [Acholeplasmataceae bacterium]
MTHKIELLHSCKTIDDFIESIAQLDYFTIINQYRDKDLAILYLEKKLLRVYTTSIILSLYIKVNQLQSIDIHLDIMSPVKEGMFSDFNATKVLIEKIKKCL